ncbi:hypothetical protein Zmor_014758 [Zophobas morio]|uniref:CRAL-TRIO domain-containing protein n=1 Tax=Zophobas morio TaxID=2755281 RepID=A0AA38IFA1_9CUCU|nr:hypothetical protein Zmor_014758 [Zophobas morio]
MPIRELSKELQEVAIKELNEDPQRIQSDLAYIKEWLSKQPHLKARTDDQFLIAFLRGTKFSLERTKEKLDMHYTLKTITPEIYHNRDPFAPEVQKILKLGVMLPLPKLISPDGPRLSLARNGLMEKHKIEQADIFKVSTMMQDILLLEDDNLAVSGFMMVQDMSDMSLGFVKSLSISLTKKAMTCFQHGYPNRIKGGHSFNITGVFEVLFNMIKPFLTEKLKRRMCVYDTLEELYKVIPREVLPEEYGGQGGKIEDIAAYWKAKIESYRDWFVEDEKYGTDEKKRPGKPKTAESVFGLEGSFRQLAVD